VRARVISALVALAAVAATVIVLVERGTGEASSSAPARPPVVLLIFDEFPTDDLLGPDGQIDAERYPNFAELARRSTWFPNAYTIYDSTFKAVPMIFDSVYPRRGTAPDLRSHHRSIFTLFARHGYAVEDLETGTAVCLPRICPGAPTRRPGVLDQLKGGGRADRLARWIGTIRRRDAPTLYVHHSLLPHEPWIYLPSGKQMRPSGEDPIGGINRPAGFDDLELTQHNEARHVLQAGFVDRQVGHLLRRLRSQGLLDDSLLVVTADHGYAFDLNVFGRRRVTDLSIDELGPVPLFVKSPRQDEGSVDRSYVRTIDILPTVADLLGWRVPWRHFGRSAFEPVTRGRREVAIPTRDFSRTVRIGAAEMERRRRQNRSRRARLYGTGVQSRALFGDPWAMLYRTGPHSELLGRRVAELPVTAPGPARASFYDAQRVHRVDHRARVVPVKLAGFVTGPGGPGRDVVIAVNGRVRGSGRTFALSPRRPENFSVLVPEEALRDGDNDVRVYEVRGRELVPLGRA
jgi:Sulfatase